MYCFVRYAKNVRAKNILNYCCWRRANKFSFSFHCIWLFCVLVCSVYTTLPYLQTSESFSLFPSTEIKNIGTKAKQGKHQWCVFEYPQRFLYKRWNWAQKWQLSIRIRILNVILCFLFCLYYPILQATLFYIRRTVKPHHRSKFILSNQEPPTPPTLIG